MTDWINTLLAVVIVLLIILIVWSKIMHQSILDTVKEIKDIVTEVKK